MNSRLATLIVAIFGLILLGSGAAPAQVPAPSNTQPATPMPSMQAPAPRDGMPPDSLAPAHHAATNEEVRDRIETTLLHSPGLEGADLQLSVTDGQVNLGGVVVSREQRELALRIISSFAGQRGVVDRLTVRSSPLVND